MYSLLLYCCSIELAESVWYLYKATGNPLLLEVAKSMITAIDKIARVKCGFATVKSYILLSAMMN